MGKTTRLCGVLAIAAVAIVFAPLSFAQKGGHGAAAAAVPPTMMNRSAPDTAQQQMDPFNNPLYTPINNGSVTNNSQNQKTDGATVSITSLEAPPAAKKAFEKGAQQMKKGEWNAAQSSLEKAVSIYPKYAVAWYGLGVCFEAENKVEDAIKASQRAIAADPKYPDSYRTVAMLAVKQRKWQDAAFASGKLTELDPLHFPEGYYLNAVANLNLFRFDAAVKSAREAIQHDSSHSLPNAEQVLGLALADENKYSEAEQHLQAYLAQTHDPSAISETRQQLAIVQDAEKKAEAQKPPSPAEVQKLPSSKDVQKAASSDTEPEDGIEETSDR